MKVFLIVCIWVLPVANLQSLRAWLFWCWWLALTLISLV